MIHSTPAPTYFIVNNTRVPPGFIPLRRTDFNVFSNPAYRSVRFREELPEIHLHRSRRTRGGTLLLSRDCHEPYKTAYHLVGTSDYRTGTAGYRATTPGYQTCLPSHNDPPFQLDIKPSYMSTMTYQCGSLPSQTCLPWSPTMCPTGL